MENPIKMDDLGAPLFLETPIYCIFVQMQALGFNHVKKFHLPKTNRDQKREIFDLGVSKNNGAPKSSILIGFSIINHPFWGTPIIGNTHLKSLIVSFFTSNYTAMSRITIVG